MEHLFTEEIKKIIKYINRRLYKKNDKIGFVALSSKSVTQ